MNIQHAMSACKNLVQKLEVVIWGVAQRKKSELMSLQPYLLRISISPNPQKTQGALQRRRELRAGGWARTLCIVHPHEYNHSKLYIYMCVCIYRYMCVYICICQRKNTVFTYQSLKLTQREKEFYMLVLTVNL